MLRKQRLISRGCHDTVNATMLRRFRFLSVLIPALARRILRRRGKQLLTELLEPLNLPAPVLEGIRRLPDGLSSAQLKELERISASLASLHSPQADRANDVLLRIIALLS